MEFRGKRVTVMGLGHFGGGLAAARWLARQGAIVTVSDRADEKALAKPIDELRGEPIHAFHLGGHAPADFSEADLVVVNPAVRPDNPMLEVARKGGAKLCSEIELFMKACPARMVGVTGSNGKSTTAAMTAAILEAAGNRVRLGGNIGGSLLDRIDEMTADDWVVLELSSFQLWHMTEEARGVDVAVVTGCTTNHLDWHGTFEHYVAAKRRILTLQSEDSAAVLNLRDEEVAAWKKLVRGKLMPVVETCKLPPLRIPGEHNRGNAALAAAAAMAAGCEQGAIQRGIGEFAGLPQRLELFSQIAGRKFYNDTTSTTPESTIAALRSIEAPLWLLAGGRNKGFELTELATEIVALARGVAVFGSVADELRDRIAAINASFACFACRTMEDALHWCYRQSRPSDAIVLSPGFASTDQFRNFQHRGQQFVRLVRDIHNPVDTSGPI